MAELYEVLLTDLGGVVIELDGVPVWRAWTGREEEAQVWERWLRSVAVRRFETGRSSPLEFAREIIAEFDLAVEPGQFLEEFAAWPKGVYPTVGDLLARARRRIRLACLSNCNQLHWPRFLDEMGLGRIFDACFSSHEMGALKPDREVFDLVVAQLDCERERILFLDDNQSNVAGARSAGLSARQVRGPVELRAVLDELGLLD